MAILLVCVARLGLLAEPVIARHAVPKQSLAAAVSGDCFASLAMTAYRNDD
jgi:hypothetical protein